MTKPRNRAAQDSTLINLRALKKELATLQKRQRDTARTVQQIIKHLWPRGHYVKGQD